MPMLEGRIEHVIGVDTHRDSHAAAVLDPTGGLLAQVETPASQAGYEQLLGFVAERAPGRRCWALEGTGCYGAGLASFLADHGEWVVEIDRPSGPAAARPRATPWTRSELDEKHSAATSWPAHASGASARRCECCSSPAPAPSR